MCFPNLVFLVARTQFTHQSHTITYSKFKIITLILTGFNPEGYLHYLATRFIFGELERETPNKAINNLVDNTCGDPELLHRLRATYDVVTFTDRSGDLRKNEIASFLTATGTVFCSHL